MQFETPRSLLECFVPVRHQVIHIQSTDACCKIPSLLRVVSLLVLRARDRQRAEVTRRPIAVIRLVVVPNAVHIIVALRHVVEGA